MYSMNMKTIKDKVDQLCKVCVVNTEGTSALVANVVQVRERGIESFGVNYRQSQ